MTYVSSIMTKYGDIEKVKQDVKTLNEILTRQGSSLLIDVIAESIGNAAIKFKMSDLDRNRLQHDIVSEFNNSICERI